MKVKIEKLSHEFRGIAKVNNKITFIPNTIPGEIVDINITKQNKKINEGEVLSYISKSNYRVEEVCPYYNECGGCNTSHIEYHKTLEYKKEIVRDIMKKYADITINPDIIFDNNIYSYRNKISLKINNGKLALVKGKSSKLINISKCYLVNNNINEIIKLLNNLKLDKVDEVIIKGTKELMVIVKGIIDKKLLIEALKEKVSSIILNNELIYGKEYINIKIKDITYAIYPDSFFQVNTNMIEKLYDKVLEYTGQDKNKSLLDLYCGAGTISIYLAKYFNKIRGIEVNKDAIKGANLNKKINNITNVTFTCQNVNKIDKIDEDIVILDPPRGGLDKITINKIIDSSVKQIIYVSCNPLTLARDLNILKEKYYLKDMTLIDMFPNTSHVECVTVIYLK